MAILVVRRGPGRGVVEEVSTDHPLPVSVENLARTTRIVEPDPVIVPGIGTGAVYAPADAFGTKFSFMVPTRGILQTARFIDLDDEGLAMEMVLFNRDFTATADNAVFAVSDADAAYVIGVIDFSVFRDMGGWQLSQNDEIGLSFVTPAGRIWAQMVTRGAPNIAAGSEPRVSIMVVSYE